MAIIPLIDGVDAAVSLAAATVVTVTAAQMLTADNFAVGEYAHVWRLGPSGDYKPATNEKGPILLSTFPNMVLVEGPATYKITKTITAEEAYVGREAL